MTRILERFCFVYFMLGGTLWMLSGILSNHDPSLQWAIHLRIYLGAAQVGLGPWLFTGFLKNPRKKVHARPA